MITVRELVAKLGFDIDQASIRKFDQAIEGAKTGMYEIGQRAQQVGKSMQGVGLAMTAGLTLPIALVGRSMIKAASDAEESAQKFNVVFRDIRKEADLVAENFGRSFGIAKAETKKLIGSTGDLLTGFGFTQEQALNLSEKVARLGGDLASFQNIAGGTTEAVDRLTKGILGETENLKLLGIVVRQDSKEFKDIVAKIQASTGATLTQAKAQAILQISTEQSKNAIGDFARTSEGHANKMRILKSRIDDVSVSFGSLLLPMATRVVGFLEKVFTKLESMPESTKKMIITGAAILAVLGPIILIVGTMIVLIGQAISSFALIKGALLGLGLAGSASIGGMLILLGQIIAVALAIGAVLYVVIDDFITWIRGGDSVIGALIGKFEEFKNVAVKVFNAIKNILSSFWTALTTNSEESWTKFINALLDGVKMIPSVLGFIISKALEFFVSAISNLALIIINIIYQTFKFLLTRAFSFGATLGKMIYDGIMSSKFAQVIGSVFSKIGSGQNYTNAYSSMLSGVSGPVIPPARTLSSMAGSTNSTKSQHINVRNNNTINVPPGTSEQQRNFLEESATKIFEKTFSKKINDSFFAVPRGEQ